MWTKRRISSDRTYHISTGSIHHVYKLCLCWIMAPVTLAASLKHTVTKGLQLSSSEGSVITGLSQDREERGPVLFSRPEP